MESIRVGILDAGVRKWTKSDVDALAEWVIRDRIAILTGFFPQSRKCVEAFAQRAGAIGTCPVFQGVQCWDYTLDKWMGGVTRTYFLFFGYYRRIHVQQPVSVLPYGWGIGRDVFEDMIPVGELPEWPENDHGSLLVPHLGTIKTKAADFARWTQYVVPTCVWLGTATPSYSSQEKESRSRGKASKDKGHGKAKDKGHGTDKGQGQGKYKGGKTRSKGKAKDKSKPQSRKGKGKGKGQGKGNHKDKRIFEVSDDDNVTGPSVEV
jgi:hypothetical protein